jgi:hypothetical protein
VVRGLVGDRPDRVDEGEHVGDAAPPIGLGWDGYGEVPRSLPS